MKILRLLNNLSKTKSNSIILEDENGSSITYEDFEIATGKLYNYLLSLNIEKEKIIAIRLKRSYRCFITMIGAMKAAIPFVIIGDTSPDEYIKTVNKECEPVLTIDDKLLDTILDGDYLKGYKFRNLHDLAFVVYSTGSSGFFKGSMHEYGALDELYNRLEKTRKEYKMFADELEEACFLFQAGLYGIGAIVDLFNVIVFKTKAVIIKSENANRVDHLKKLAAEKNALTVVASPLTLPDFLNNPSSTIKSYCVSYEIFSYKYNPNFFVYNDYGLTEACGTLCSMPIEKDYDIVPVGKPTGDFVVKIVNKDDEPIIDNQIGELAFIPYYFRGYIKHDDLFKKAFYNGYFHTGDLAYYDEDKNIVLVGRKNDILETNEGYVVPVFISNEIKKDFKDIKKCYIKIFKDENPNMIVMYYISDVNHTLNEINNKIKNKIPSYSLPTHIVKLEQFAYFYCGKINKNLFKKPSIK